MSVSDYVGTYINDASPTMVREQSGDVIIWGLLACVFWGLDGLRRYFRENNNEPLIEGSLVEKKSTVEAKVTADSSIFCLSNILCMLSTFPP